jgi:hypothetical protein
LCVICIAPFDRLVSFAPYSRDNSPNDCGPCQGRDNPPPIKPDA